MNSNPNKVGPKYTYIGNVKPKTPNRVAQVLNIVNVKQTVPTTVQYSNTTLTVPTVYTQQYTT